MQQHIFSTICASCRLHQYISAQQALRTGKSIITAKRQIHASSPLRIRQRRTPGRQRHDGEDSSIEDTVTKVRQAFGDRLPDGLLSAEEGKVYERLYGRPLKTVHELDHHAGRRRVKSKKGATQLETLSNGGWTELPGGDAGLDSQPADRRHNRSRADEQLLRDIEAAAAAPERSAEVETDYAERDESYNRVHPLTRINRFGTSPSTLYLPKHELTDQLDQLTKRTAGDVLKDAAHRIFGGIGLPESASTPALGKVLKQKPIPLDVSQSRMSEIEGDAFTTVLMPAMYATITSVLVETRKRLGTQWAESMVRKAEEGTLQILDAGGAGMGILAVRDMLKAEWERMKEAEQDQGMSMSMALAGGKTGGALAPPPLGKATAWIASDALRQRASTILQDTTIIPRMPDYVHTENARYSGKFDIVIAAHTIWPIREDWERRLHVENLWSLLRADSGVLCMLEKGVARGFEAIAAARRFLLRNRIAKPGSVDSMGEASEEGDWKPAKAYPREPGMIIAPCTNHEECPMYSGEFLGTIKGRTSICHFEQRFIRPASLQKILRARDKNHEDIKFSYLSVMRGTDLRSSKTQSLQSSARVRQDDYAVDAAAKGFESWTETAAVADTPSSLSLPRIFLPPIKRPGHVLIDMCTPAGKLERWTVPRSFSKQAFRDARKSGWGDLWALGAKTRIAREAKLGKFATVVKQQPKKELSKKALKAKRLREEKKAWQQEKGVLGAIEA